ncbi:MAG: glycosyltransferase family 4 protein [Candidatus Micrarchaeota archaeon]
MDVLVFYPAIFQKGGGDRLILELAREFDAPIYTAFYDKTSAFSEFSELDVRVLKRPLFEKPFFFLRKDINAYTSAVAGMEFLTHKVKDDYDVINAHAKPGNWIRNRNERVCWYFYSPVRSAFDLYSQKVASLPFHKRMLTRSMHSWYMFWERRIDPKIEKTVSVSPYVNVRDKAFLDEYVGKPVEPIPPGVHADEFRNEGYDKYFFYPSRVVPEKRFEYAIEAFRKFSAKMKNANPSSRNSRPETGNWKLILAGHVPNREREHKYFEGLMEMAKGLDVEFRTDLPEEELKSLYARCYAVLFCPIKEDWGLVPLEAMSSEKPCISVDEGGPKYTILEGKTGFLVDSTEKMAQRMLELAADPDLNEKMGREGRKHVLKNFTWEMFFKKMRAAFQEVAKAKEGASDGF